MEHTSLRSWLLSTLVACSAFLSSCTGVCVGDVCLNVESQSGIPLLYADVGVRVERPAKGELPYQSGMVLLTGDVVQTTGGFAVIDFDDDYVIALRENTRIEVGSITLFLGEVFAHIGKIVERGGGQVTTDELSASVRGTEYSVRRTPFPGRADLGNTAVIVRNGTVLCEDRVSRRWPAVEVAQNRMFRVEGKQLPRPPQYVDAQAETGWADKVVQRLLVRRPSGIRPEIGIPFSVGPQSPRDRPSPQSPSSSSPSSPSSSPPSSSPPSRSPSRRSPLIQPSPSPSPSPQLR
jgi:FecR protein